MGSAGVSHMFADDDSPFDPMARAVVFGLTPRLDESAFRARLGVPTTEGGTGDLRCAWKRSGYRVEAVFMRDTGLGLDGLVYEKGTLLWFEVTRAP